jgi:phosphate:Na+ symporter
VQDSYGTDHEACRLVTDDDGHPPETLKVYPQPFLAAPGSQEIDVFVLLMTLFGGLALFLFGMDRLTTTLKTVAGDRMKTTLARLTGNRVSGFATGAGVTAVIQSSSVTTVLVVGFISAGLMTLPQSIGVILGAGIGTTITAQIIAFKVTKYALLLVALGFGAAFVTKRERIRSAGFGLMGLGLIFYGMAVMSEAMEPLRTYEPFLDAMTRLENPLLGIAVAALFTALVQSSSASIGIIIVLAGQGLVSLEAGISLLFGANIGTTVTALLASIGRSREALRAAVAHTIFRVAGVLLWVFFIDDFARLATAISPESPGLSGMDRMAAETPRQIANAHTLFNVINAALFLPFVNQFAALMRRIIPYRTSEADEVAHGRPRYLDRSVLATPALALDRARREILRMGGRVRDMVAVILPAVLAGTEESLAEIEAMDDAVDDLHGYIIRYLGDISTGTLSDREADQLIALMDTANAFEAIGDIVETNLVGLGHDRIDRFVVVSELTTTLITRYHRAILDGLDATLAAIDELSEDTAQQVVAMKRELNTIAADAREHVNQRLVAPDPNRLASYRTEIDILENLRRIFYYVRRAAKAAPLVPPDPE